MVNFVSSAFLSFYFLIGLLYCEEGNGEVTGSEEIAHRGRYTRDVHLANDYEIVVPRKVSADGRFVSHRIPHHFKRSSYKGKRRSDMRPDDALHYRVRIDGEEQHLELYPNHRLLGPGAIVERRLLNSGRAPTDENFLNGSKLKRPRDTGCHYRGGVRDHRENSALSACYGLAGYIRTKRSLYLIEPMDGYDFTGEAEHPHIVYRRSSDELKKEAEALCNVAGNLARNLGKRAVNLRKRNPPAKAEQKLYTLELLAVLDRSLLDYHRDFDVENYVLTLFNMAAGLFRDVSLGVEMELVIVRIMRLEVEEDEMNLSMNKDAETTLKSFQEWQKRINPGDDSHPNHHDCAVLITRVDICTTRALCAFTGMSTIAGTCDPLKGAAVVKDNGLRTGYHIAHHIGHTLGMSHDVEKENGCSGIIVHRDGYVETSVMYPGNPYVTKMWSKCSQSYIKLYMQAGMATCLLDEAQDHHFLAVDMLPGVMYNGDDQCRLRYRQDVRQCDLGITCESLKCAVPGKGCLSSKSPPAEGTPCGERKWCYQMKCIMVGERPGAVDAGWSAWSPWSRCSRTCGSGVAFSERRCDHPPPSKGGAYCPGNWKRHKICATEPCEIGAPSFRDAQCAEFNDWIFPEDGKVHQWVGYNLPENLRASENPCVLFCLSETKLVTSLKPKVVDGTTCYRGIRDICIDGICREIPCDLDMESDAVEDACGVCKGDSTSCDLKEGTVLIEQQTRLKKLIDLPVGSRNIRVEEAQPTKSRIIVESKSTKNVLIDGNHLGMFDVPGSKAWLGMIRAKQEALNIPGPISEDLVVLVNPKENVTIKYSLGLMRESTSRKPAFEWDFVEWSKCSAPCGPGAQTSDARCVEKTGGRVDDDYCANITKPKPKYRPCNQAPCVPRWMIGDWQGCTPCTPSCKKVRAVKCIRPVGHGQQEVDVIADSYCQGPKPKESEACKSRARRDNVLGSDASCARRGKGQGEGCGSVEGVEERSSFEKSGRAEDVVSGKTAGDTGALKSDVRALIVIDRSPRMRKRTDDDGAESGEDSRGARNEKRNEAANANNDGESNGDSGQGWSTADIKKGQVVVDKEDVKNLTLTVILERDDDNVVVNFPKDFKPQPPANGTEFTLVGMDAIRYIQRIQDEGRATPQAPPP